MNGSKAHKKTKNISINNVNEVQHQQVTEVSKEDGDFLTLLYSPQPLPSPENTALKANYSIRTGNTVSEYQDIADTECNQHITQIDSAQDKREYGDDNYICGCGCESCCGCGHDL
ncbi:protein MceE [Klebsiella pneumoniae]|uniref:protein MceE n=1 Tax=Klebsiella pneumoniae TaxID=573 RepID=UPI000E2D3023|nr:protein MceE [Klebsiella pneumoniae]CAF1962537.1 hypothetical protein AI2621V1_1680 [Klebsiella pneumoniae]CAH5017227.1 hypothetical protein AI2621V1_1680 [Klebsiella pneumoniae]SWW45660.1 Uncharacterised protein [Klebsiella pneumoniae]SWW87553.1 Uncharacterised protein [Klebsiella pneumoniae]